MTEQEKLKIEYDEFSQKIAEEAEPQMYDWILMVQFACGGLENAVRAIKDAYRLGFADGKGATVDKVLSHFENGRKAVC